MLEEMGWWGEGRERMDDCFCVGFLVGAQKRAVNFFLCRGASHICVFCASIIKQLYDFQVVLMPR